ncbi:MAG: hypothetical protein ACI4RH_04560 [Huintestinicola sp.]
MVFSACSKNGETRIPELSVITSEEQTNIISEEAIVSERQKTESLPVSTETESVSTETEAAITTADMTEGLISEASRLMGALDYIDRIGGGNIHKDDNDMIESDGRQYARVIAQFENVSDLHEYITENLTDRFIQSRYSQITGTDQPYYIDNNGALYGYVTAKGCGYFWILENDQPVISVTDVSDDSFTAITKFDNFGGESEMKLQIVFRDGLWKIDSISYDGMTF